MIISRDISEDSAYGKAFRFLRSLNYNVLLAHPHIAPSGKVLETVTARWLWETLSSGGAPTSSSQPVSQSVSSRYDVSQSIATAVFWDVEDCSVASTGLYPRLIRRKITSALKDNGYNTGRVSFTAYGERNKIRDDFTSAEIMFVPGGDKHGRATRIFDDLLTWAKKRRLTRLMIIVSSDISQDSAFVVAFDLLRSLNHNVLLAQPRSSPIELPITVAAQWLWETLSAGGPPTLWRIP